LFDDCATTRAVWTPEGSQEVCVTKDDLLDAIRNWTEMKKQEEIEQHRVRWNLPGSVFFAITVVTTIGGLIQHCLVDCTDFIYYEQGIAPEAARRYDPHRWQFDEGISFRRQSGHLRQSIDPKIAADLRPSADRSAVRTSLVAGGG